MAVNNLDIGEVLVWSNRQNMQLNQ